MWSGELLFVLLLLRATASSRQQDEHTILGSSQPANDTLRYFDGLEKIETEEELDRICADPTTVATTVLTPSTLETTTGRASTPRASTIQTTTVTLSDPKTLAEPSSNIEESSGSAGTIVAITSAMSVLMLLVVVIVVILIVVRRRRNKKSPFPATTRKSPNSVSSFSYQKPSPSLGTKRQMAKNAKKLQEQSSSVVSIPLEPKNMEHEPITKKNAQFVGPLRVQAGIKDTTRHGTDGIKSMPLQRVEYDPKMNKVYDIGSDVEILETRTTGSTAGRTTMTTDLENTVIVEEKSRPGAKKNLPIKKT